MSATSFLPRSFRTPALLGIGFLLATGARLSATTWADGLVSNSTYNLTLASALSPTTGYTHLAWVAGLPNVLNYTYQDGTGFHTVSFTAAQVATKIGISTSFIVRNDISFGPTTSIVIDASGNPHIGFSGGITTNAASERGIFYGTYNGSGAIDQIANWTFSRVATYTNPSGWRDAVFAAIAIDPTVSRPAIAWALSDTASTPRATVLQYVTRNSNGTWPAGTAASSTAASTGSTTMFQTSGGADGMGYLGFAIDSNGKHHFVAAVDPTGGATWGRLTYGTDLSGSWATTDFVNVSAFVVTSTGLLIDGSNRPRVAWGDYRDKTAKLEVFDGTSWSESTVLTATSNSGYQNRVGYAQAGTVELLTMLDRTSSTNYAVKTASRIGGSGSWTAETAVTTALVTGNLFGLEVRPTLRSTGEVVIPYAINSFDTGFPAGSIRAVTGTLSVAPPDTTKPTVVSVVRLTPSTQPLTTATTSVTFRVTYSEAVTGVVAANFQIENFNGGTITGTVGTPTGGTTVYDVPVTLTGGSGEFRLKVVN